MRGPVAGMFPYPSHSMIKNTPCRSYYTYTLSYLSVNVRNYAITPLNQPLPCPLCQHSLSIFLFLFCSLFLVLLQEWQSPLQQFFHFTRTLNSPILHFLPPLLFCTKNTGFRYGRESMTSHIKHTSERDPHAMTRGPKVSLYKSNRSKLPRKPGP